MQTPIDTVATGFAERVAFVIALAQRLHAYGTTAQRLEGAVVAVTQRLRLECEPWSNPTGMILSFSDPTRPAGTSETTRVIRLAPGDTNLYKLCEADRIAEEVMAGHIGIAQGQADLRALDGGLGWRGRAQQVFGFGLASAAVAGLLRLPWLDLATAGLIGLLIGVLEQQGRGRPRLQEASDAIAGMVAGFVAIAVASLVAPLNLNTVTIAALIVLLPGMALTNAINELTSRHLVSGTARFAGALTTVLKLTVGTAIALTVAELAGLEPEVRAWRPQPDWVAWVALVAGAYAFAVLFRANRRDYPLVMASAMAGYLISRFGDEAFGSPAGVFLAALVTTAAGNAYARWIKRPGALIRVPGIIMLVPGSLALRGVISSVQQQDLSAGQSAAIAALNILMALIAGLLFGNLLVSARRNL
ncbi:threonine/serine exporter family protein [Lysobacter sp. CFH 32150]|uniref:threonine/serine ThrE exporter family protein n=1 Tax=Lysobacter sp. CFH 32150 TaxID=2927128 RepID=UPI001FA77178|nr:threonine/serine exporter family protein [Lysobacter sp. CFH 32150]MCI4567650.1 threonine/serine exporter family protein [Lysobacter sp. CFH 32150]